MADSTEYGCSAVVTITIQVEGQGHWGKEATVQEVMDQGGRETLAALTNALQTTRLRYKILGEPNIGAVTWKREAK